jgi:hypothetical protein
VTECSRTVADVRSLSLRFPVIEQHPPKEHRNLELWISM